MGPGLVLLAISLLPASAWARTALGPPSGALLGRPVVYQRVKEFSLVIALGIASAGLLLVAFSAVG